jgi:hypothetical protein
MPSIFLVVLCPILLYALHSQVCVHVLHHSYRTDLSHPVPSVGLGSRLVSVIERGNLSSRNGGRWRNYRSYRGRLLVGDSLQDNLPLYDVPVRLKLEKGEETTCHCLFSLRCIAPFFGLVSGYMLLRTRMGGKRANI